MTGRRPAATRRWLPSTDYRRVAGPEHDDDAVVPLLDPLDPDPGMELDPVLEERALEHRRHLGVVAGEEAGGLEDRDLGAEAAVGLRQLRPDRPAADDEEPLRPPRKIEDALVGEVRNLVEPRDRRRGRARAGGEDEAAGLNDDLARRDGVGPGEARLRLDDADAERGETLGRIVRGDRLDHAADMVAHPRHVDLRVAAADAEARAVANALSELARGDQRLRRHAADIEAVAAHAVALDEDDRHAE